MAGEFIMKLVPLFVLTALILFQKPASAKENPSGKEAEKHFALGVYFYEDGDYHEARKEFESSYRLKPHFSLHYNIGLCWMKKGNPAKALTEFTLYSIEGGSKVDEEIEKTLLEVSSSLKKKVAVVQLDGQPDETQVLVDGNNDSLGSKGAHFYINPGQHIIEVIEGGKKLVSMVVMAEANEAITIDVSAGMDAGEAVVKYDAAGHTSLPMEGVPAFHKKEKEKSALSGWLWATAILSAGCLITGTVIGGIALSEKKEMVKAEDMYLESISLVPHEQMQSILDDRNSHYHRAKEYGDTSTSMFVIGGALFVTAAVLFIFKMRQNGKKGKEKNIGFSFVQHSIDQPLMGGVEIEF